MSGALRSLKYGARFERAREYKNQTSVCALLLAPTLCGRARALHTHSCGACVHACLRAYARVCRVAELLRVASSKLGYLKIVTPHRAGSSSASTTSSSGSGGGRYISRDGKLIRIDQAEDVGAHMEKAKYSNWTGGNLDPDDVARHQRNLRRFQFMDRPGGVPKGPFG